MFSVVLAMALSNGAVTPSYHAEGALDHVRYGNHLQSEQYRGRRRRGGCCGCSGGGWGGGCYGGGCYGGGCYGGGYGGCMGGYAMGYGGCTGGYAVGYGGCTGGYAGSYGGCTGGHIVGYGTGSGYTMGTWGAPYGAAYEGSMPVYGGSTIPMPAETGTREGTGYQRRYEDENAQPSNRDERRDERRDNRNNNRSNEGKSRTQTGITAPATLVVTLPADAKLVVDGHVTRSTSAERSFITPALPTGENFSYSLKATIMRDGQPVTVSRQVTVRGGEETRVNLRFPEASLSRR